MIFYEIRPENLSNKHWFWQLFATILHVIFWAWERARDFFQTGISGGGHLGHITDKGGTEITLRPQAVTHPSKSKLIAAVTKQLASQIIEPIFLIYVDLRWLRDLHFRYRGLLLVSLGALGLTFGTTQGHQKGHLGPPWRTFETRHRKHPKRSLFWYLFWDSNLMTFRVCICPCFYKCSKRRKWCPNVAKCQNNDA